MTDALNKEIIIGQTYGYSQNNNGITNIRIGVAEKYNEGKVTLLVTESKTAVYNSTPRNWDKTGHKISVKSNMLFPIKE
jgi:hypothetical protein